ncbi:MAG TPA: PKD domain-containing protein [Bacteroidia bacterium]|nr:PKD domain-containing protein [Bacteroidia bacterium]
MRTIKELMRAIPFIVVLMAVVVYNGNVAAQVRQLSSVSCSSYLDQSPLTRASGFGEENVVNTNYQAVAQQYNALSGAIYSVRFWARMNPAVSTSNTVKVIIYREQGTSGLPGAILGQVDVTVPNGNTVVQIDAVFATAVSVNSSFNTMIALELFSSGQDDFFVRRNVVPNGQNLNLIKIKQFGNWYNNLASGDTAFNFDFLFLPVAQSTVAAGFSSSANGGVVTFTNTSSGASSSYWDFDDGNTSTSTSPSHTYSASGTYNVKLNSYYTDVTCYDSVTHQINVVVAGINSPSGAANAGWTYEIFNDRISIRSSDNCVLSVLNILGSQEASYNLIRGKLIDISTAKLPQGVYILHSRGKVPIRFIKN